MRNFIGKKFLLLIMAVIMAMANPYPAFADDNTASIEKRLNDLEAQVTELKGELAQQKQAAVPPAANTTTTQTLPTAYVTANAKDGFSIKSANGDYSFRMGGYTQVEAREFADNNKEELGEASSILARRVRLQFTGTVARDFDFYIQPDFSYNNTYSYTTPTGYTNGSPLVIASTPSAYAVSLPDAWIDYKYFPDAIIKAGKMKTPFDLENLQDSRWTDFVELGLTGNLSPQRDLGVQVGGNLYYDWITYAAGLFDGAADKETGYGGYSTGGDTNSKNGVGRVFANPFKDTGIDPLKGFGIGFAASYGKEKGTDLPVYISPGQAPVFAYNYGVSAAGPQLRTEPQADFYYKSLGILVERVSSQETLQYTNSSGHIVRDKPDNKAWSLEGSYVLTGEDASYNGVIPKNDLNPSKGHWGAFELVSRYGELKLDHRIFDDGFSNLNTSISNEQAWAFGFNWYLNRNIKVAFAFEQTKFDRGAYVVGGNSGNNGNRKTENLFTTMLQLSM